MFSCTYHHWKKKEVVYEVTGSMLPAYNNPNSDRIIIIDKDLVHHDILKNTIIELKAVEEET
jgi:hypothetical protein